MLTSLEYKRVNKQTRSVRVRRVFKVRNFRTRREVRGLGLGLEVVHFSKNSKNDIQFFEKFRKKSKKLEKISTTHFVLFKPLFLVQTSIIALYMNEYFNEVLNF
jgi:hypothetical protein